MNKLSAYPKSKFALLLVGDQKTGKTRIAAGFPKPCFFDFDGNLTSIVNEQPELADEISFVDPYTKDGAALKPAEVWKHAIGTLLPQVAADPDIETVVIDSLSSIDPIAQEFVLADQKKKLGVRKGGFDDMQLTDYGKLGNLYGNLGGFLKNCGKTVVVTSHQKIKENEKTGVWRYELNISGRWADNFGIFFSDVWGTNVKPGREGASYKILTTPSNKHIGLGRSAELPNEIDATGKKPTEIFEGVRGKLGL